MAKLKSADKLQVKRKGTRKRSEVVRKKEDSKQSEILSAKKTVTSQHSKIVRADKKEKYKLPEILKVGKQGVILDMNEVGETFFKKIKKALKVKPKTFSPYDAETKPFPIYKKESDTCIHIPPHYIITHYPQIKLDWSGARQGKKINVKFQGEMRIAQLPVVNAISKGLNEHHGGIVTIPCAGGKTVLAIKEICQRGLKTMVLVHKSFLAKQWIKRLKRFSNARIGTIQGKKVDVKDKDVIIAMVQSVAKSKYDERIFDDFGMVIIDECHHMGAPIFCRALSRIYCKNMLGLSATPERDDGLSKIFHYWMGPTLYYEATKSNSSVVVQRYHYTCDDPNFKQCYTWMRGGIKLPNHVMTLTKLIGVKKRNNFIVNRILERLECEGAKILVLSARRDHLTSLKLLLEKRWREKQSKWKQILFNLKAVLAPEKYLIVRQSLLSTQKSLKTAYYIGGMTEEALEKAEEADVLFGTYQMAEEGLDIEALNTLVLATTKPKIEQSVGRILRKVDHGGNIKPTVIDLADQLPMCLKQAKRRDEHYQKSNFKIYEYDQQAKPMDPEIQDNGVRTLPKVNKKRKSPETNVKCDLKRTKASTCSF
jgi:superfamily II DNA or RNA helicase